MPSRNDSRRCRSADVALAALALAALACILALASCRTYEAVVGAPPGFWLHVETILWALWQDIYDVVSFLL